MVHLLLIIIYISFVSLGLPDALLGAAWPTMCLEFSVPVSYAGAISMIIAAGTIVSSLLSDRMTRWLGPGKVTAISVAMTALAIFGFSVSNAYWMLILWAIPYGLGAGSVDASLNNYVALHYASRHMSWLHCMWGLGASIGPYILGYALSMGQQWHMGYRYIAILQIVLTAVLLFSVPLWKNRSSDTPEEKAASDKPLSLAQILKIPGAKEVFIAFFCYCAAEQTAILWGSSYLVLRDGLNEEIAASFGSLFLIGLTIGRFLSGFLTYKLNDRNMIRLGQGLMVLGVAVMVLPFGTAATIVGLILIGLGCAPIYPCIIHSTPEHFGAENSQALIGVQMASAYVGILVMPPVFGIIANHLTVALLPAYIGAITVTMILMCESLNKKSIHA
ncbi:MAG: MFS transporter [Oscillospiraceae bacterium]|nr:MFS transporter [Oscillospiraceae bacterium]